MFQKKHFLKSDNVTYSSKKVFNKTIFNIELQIVPFAAV